MHTQIYYILTYYVHTECNEIPGFLPPVDAHLQYKLPTYVPVLSHDAIFTV